ncbi:MAG: UDP-N-acetylglucosamine 2-epimerase (non-hydrolyzing) [Deltaproteobacteria bacterium]|nr:UDP-N-acetylglucosamine 2-epimerase (non-hydrolyzing) [Deltaproteobacteria bacterium]
MKPERVACVVGARPNFMKVAPVHAALRARGVQVRLVHTGQHYDDKMSAVFFDDLGMPRPDAFLGVGSGSHADQTAKIMTLFERDCLDWRPDLTLVAGDVNSTIACALVASKLGLAVGHIEAGLRSRDWGMPEEINRVLTDHASDLLLTPSRDGDANLAAEGIAPWRIRFVGNCMIDSLRTHQARAVALQPWQAFGLRPGAYAVATLHRPSNVDDPAQLAALVAALADVAAQLPVVFPVHPRTAARMRSAGLAPPAGLHVVEPLGYLQFLGVMARAAVVATDSGGIQEETTALGVPCLTLRANTERPVTLTEGTNTLLGTDPARLAPAVAAVLEGRGKAGRIPEGWDGHAAERIADAIAAGFDTLLERSTP